MRSSKDQDRSEGRQRQQITETLTTSGAVRYAEYTPHPRLAPYIACYWTFRSSKSLSPGLLHRVVPDGCIDIIFSLSAHSNLPDMALVGTMTRPILTELADTVNYVAVRFRPAAFACFFRQTACELVDRIVPLDAMPNADIGRLYAQLCECADLNAMIALLDSHFCDRLCADHSDRPLAVALRHIDSKGGNITIDRLAALSGYSRRHLRRKFNEHIGIGPKAFCRIIRFQRVLNVLRQMDNFTYLPVALDAGYYDQAHFIHEFNTYYGQNPSAYLKRHRL